jgi:hypothetical protein
VISKIDLGLKQCIIDKTAEERIDFRSIINIPVHICYNNDHPTLNNNVFKGADFKIQSSLYKNIQDMVKNPDTNYLSRITTIKKSLKKLEEDIITRTKASITMEEQLQGKLIQRYPMDAKSINRASHEFFTIINDICRDANLARRVPIVQQASVLKARKKLANETIMPGITLMAIAKHIDQAIKRSRSIYQRTILLHNVIKRLLRTKATSKPYKEKDTMIKYAKKLFNQETLFTKDIQLAISTCREVAEDRVNHIVAIETARGKKIFDKYCQFHTMAIEYTGKQEFEKYTRKAKQEIFEISNASSAEIENCGKISKIEHLQNEVNKWHKDMDDLKSFLVTPESCEYYHKWKCVTLAAVRKINRILHMLQHIRHEEWINAKMHYIRIGKYGAIARMMNPKERTGPTPSNTFPMKPGEPVRQAITDEERIQASTATHEMWIGDPPGKKNCHFLDIINDDVGPHGITINPERIFDDEAQWKYLEGLLYEKCDNEVAERENLHMAGYQNCSNNARITYPFKYDCISGTFLYPELELNLRKNLVAGNGKARATGFAIPVLGRLPRIFADVYLIKCKLQMTLWLLDIGTECSLRICIGKPCGGVRPLTVGHDDNVFLNGLAQQAIQ